LQREREIRMSTNTLVRPKGPKTIVKILFTAVTVALWIGVAVFLPKTMTRTAEADSAASIKTDITADFEYTLTKTMPKILEIAYGDVAFASTKREYTLSDQDIVAPEPNPARYGAVASAAEMADVLTEADKLLGVQNTLFTTETEILEGSQIQYYLDDTIFAVTWKQVVGGGVYTFSEVKLAHASQFRRFLADGKYGSFAAYTTQEMAGSVNAVVASSGDYYGYRGTGLCVYEGTVHRGDDRALDTCFIAENGDLLFSHRGEFENAEAAQKFVDDNNIRFSLSFGPIMIENGENVVPSYYHVGEIHEAYSRAALCQMGELHYVVVAANYEHPYHAVHTMGQFTNYLLELGITKAYALDGGQTATIVMDNQVINSVSYGAQRKISDIIYFATALPEDEWR